MFLRLEILKTSCLVLSITVFMIFKKSIVYNRSVLKLRSTKSDWISGSPMLHVRKSRPPSIHVKYTRHLWSSYQSISSNFLKLTNSHAVFHCIIFFKLNSWKKYWCIDHLIDLIEQKLQNLILGRKKSFNDMTELTEKLICNRGKFFRHRWVSWARCGNKT